MLESVPQRGIREEFIQQVEYPCRMSSGQTDWSREDHPRS
jgi:hypothetical protein